MQKLIFLIIIILFTNSCSTQTNKERITTFTQTDSLQFPVAIGYVNDYAGILDSLEIKTLETKIKSYSEATTNQIAIVTLDMDKLTENNFDKYALALTNYWGVGTKEKNNGLTIIFSPKLRKIRINTGLRTEKILTNQICEKILHSIILPEFRSSNYFVGLDKATDEIIRLWK